jgi:hypothetical protein
MFVRFETSRNSVAALQPSALATGSSILDAARKQKITVVTLLLQIANVSLGKNMTV